MTRSRIAAAGVLLAVLAAGPVAAACSGPSLLDRLDGPERDAFEAAVDAVPFGEGLVWRASKGDARIVLAGTMHLSDPRHAPLAAALAPALRDADLLLLETTPEGEARAARAMTDRPELTLAPGPTLPERLPPSEWEAIAGAARDRGLPPFAVARLRPWLLLTTLSTPPCLMDLAAQGIEGSLDRLMLREAQNDGVPVEALEPWDMIFRLGDALDETARLDLLLDLLDDAAIAEASMVATLDAYFDRRPGAVAEIARLADRLAGLPIGAEAAEAAMNAVLLDDRNAAWVPVIEAASARAPRLVVAAGAAHMPGERGVLATLADRGWTVTRIDGPDCCGGVWDAP